MKKNDKKINICFFSGDINRSGGTERVSIIIANELCKNPRYNISFISLEEKRKNSFFEIDKRISRDKMYGSLNRSMFHILGIIKRLKKYVKNNDIDIIVDIDGILDIYSLPVKWMTKVKVISWEHFNFFQNPFVPYRKVSRRMAARWADAIVTLTEEDKGYYLDNLKIRGIIKAIYNPMEEIKEETVYNPESKLILSVGRLTEQKGFDRLIKIAKKVYETNKEWKWYILGEGEDRNKLEEEINNNNLQSFIILKGNVSDIESYYKDAAFFVMTSRFEGLPMTLLEAKGYKLPLISFDIKTGPRECIINGVNGFLCEDNDIEIISDKIIELMNDRKKCIEFSSHAHDEIEKFMLDSIIKNWNLLLIDLAER